jgi:hypothetical protein
MTADDKTNSALTETAATENEKNLSAVIDRRYRKSDEKT